MKKTVLIFAVPMMLAAILFFISVGMSFCIGQTESKIENEGYEAARLGIQPNSNPYIGGSGYRSKLWLKGYMQFVREERDK